MTSMCRKRTFLTFFSLDSACSYLSFSFRSLQYSNEITTSPAFSPGLLCGCRWVLRRALPGLWDRVVCFSQPSCLGEGVTESDSSSSGDTLPFSHVHENKSRPMSMILFLGKYQLDFSNKLVKITKKERIWCRGYLVG